MAFTYAFGVAKLCLCFLSLANARNIFPRQSFANTTASTTTTSACNLGLGCGFVPPVVNTSSATLTTSAPGSNGTASNSTQWTVPATGTGLSYIFACNEEYFAWGTSQISTEITNYWTATNYTALTTTYCEGQGFNALPHVIGTITPTATWRQSALTLSGYYGPTPTCSVDSAQCKSLQDELLYTFSVGVNATAMAWGNSAMGTTTTTLATEPVTTLPTFVVANRTLTPVEYNGDGYDGYSLGYHWLLSNMSSTEVWMGPEASGDPTWMPFCRKTASSTSAASTTKNVSEACPTPTCTIYGGHVQMMFFPPTTTAPPNVCATWPAGNGSFCPYGGHGAGYNNQDCGTPNSTRYANTTDSGEYVTLDGHTLYKNKAYISMESAYALDGCNNRVGGGYAGRILTMASTSIYSLCDYSNGYPPQYNAYPVNFQDFDGLIPHSAWNCMPYCNNMPLFAQFPQATQTYIDGIPIVDMDYGGQCARSLVFSEGFLPVLAVPPEIRGLDPAWRTCALDLRGLYDPPTMITQVPTAAAPTLPTAVDGPTSTADPPTPTTNAQTGPGITNPAKQTRTSTEEPKPTTPAAQPKPESTEPAFTFDPTTSADETPAASADPTQDSSDPVHPPIVEATATSLDVPAQADPTTSNDPLGNAISVILTAVNPPSAASTSAGGIASFIGQGLGISSAQTPTNAQEAMTASADPPAGSVTNIILPGTTLQPGDTATVSGNTIALPSNGNGIIVNGEASTLQTGGSGADVTLPNGVVGTAIVTQPSQTDIAVGSITQLALPGTTLQPGSAAVISGVTVSLASSGNGVFVDGTSVTQAAGAPITLASGIVATPNAATQLVIGSQTLVAGGSAVTIAGTTYTASGSQIVAVAGGHSSTFLMPGANAGTVAQDLVIGSQTLVAGGSALTVSGTTYTASGSEVVAVAGGRTTTFAIPTSIPDVVFGSQTLVPGGTALTISGTTYSAIGTDVVVEVSGHLATVDLGLLAATAVSSDYQSEALESITEAAESEATASSTRSSRSGSTRTSSSGTVRSSTDSSASSTSTSGGSKGIATYSASAFALIIALLVAVTC